MAITLEMLKRMLVSPHEFLSKVEKININTTVVLMCLNWLLISIGIGAALNNITYTIAVLVSGIVSQIIFSFILTVAFNTIGGKGSFKNALDSLTYPYFGLSLSVLLVSIISKSIPIISIVVALVLFTLYTVIGVTGMIRVLKDSFKLDAITAWITISIIMLAILFSIYLTAILYYTSSINLFSSLF